MFKLQGDHTPQHPWEGLCPGAGKESAGNLTLLGWTTSLHAFCRTSTVLGVAFLFVNE